MKKPKKQKLRTIDEIMKDGTAIDRALRQGFRQALRAHKKSGTPIVACRNGKVVWIPPEKIVVPE